MFRKKKNMNETEEKTEKETNILMEESVPILPEITPEYLEEILKNQETYDLDIDSLDCRETRGCVLMPSNRTKVNREVSLKPNMNQRNNPINNQYIERKLPKTPEPQFPAQPVIQPLQSSNRVKVLP